MRAALIVLAMAWLAPGCSSEPPRFELRAEISDLHGGVDLWVDGGVVPKDSWYYIVSREYPDYQAAVSAPPVLLGTTLGDTVIGSYELRPALCRELCGDCSREAPLVREMVSLQIAEDGSLLDWHQFPSCNDCVGETRRRIACFD